MGRSVSGQRFEAGQFITFMYRPPVQPQKPKMKYVQQKQVDGSIKRITVPSTDPPPAPSDPNKEVMVLHPNWHGKVHAVDLKRLTPAESQVLKSVMDPETKQKVDAGQWPVDGVPNYPLIRDILKRFNPNELIKNPLSFYQLLIKPFIRDKDVYRQYFPNFCFNVKVVQESKIQGQLINPAPLFKKI